MRRHGEGDHTESHALTEFPGNISPSHGRPNETGAVLESANGIVLLVSESAIARHWLRVPQQLKKTTNARLLFAKRVASGRETYGGMPKDPPHAAIAMGRLAYRVREHDSCTGCQKWPFCEFRLKIRYILRRSAPPSRAPYH